MQRLVHVVVTQKFAGVERYVANTAVELGRRGCDVAVVGGSPSQMPHLLGPEARWLPGATPREALASLVRIGRRDVCHVHMTLAEVTAIVARPVHRAPIVSTRHFARARGSARLARALAPLVSAALSREIAAGAFIAGHLERPAGLVLPNAIPLPADCWRAASRTVLVVQRLSPEKDTLTALRAWQAAGLWKEGWSLRVVGDGSERGPLEDWVRRESLPEVEFAGWVPDVEHELAGAGLLLAPAPAEPFGLVVLEAMGAGVPVVACSGGGHLETVGRLPGAALFAQQDAKAAGLLLRQFLSDDVRTKASVAGRSLVAEEFSIERHVDRLLAEYGSLVPDGPRTRRVGVT